MEMHTKAWIPMGQKEVNWLTKLFQNLFFFTRKCPVNKEIIVVLFYKNNRYIHDYANYSAIELVLCNEISSRA